MTSYLHPIATLRVLSLGYHLLHGPECEIGRRFAISWRIRVGCSRRDINPNKCAVQNSVDVCRWSWPWNVGHLLHGQTGAK
jgi:hypothetical protein